MKKLRSLRKLGINCLLLFLVISFNSCGVKKIERAESIDYTQLKSRQIINYYKQKSGKYDSLFVKKIRGNIELPGEKHSFKGYLKWINNKELQVSIIPMLGIEAFRCYFTVDSIFIIDKVNKVYRTGSYLDLSRLLGYNVDLDLIQDIFIKGIPYSKLDKTKIINKFPKGDKEASVIDFVERNPDPYFFKLLLNSEKINQLNYKISKKSDITIDGNVQYTEEYLPLLVDFNFKSSKNTVAVLVKYSNIDKSDFRIRFREPRGYKHLKL